MAKQMAERSFHSGRLSRINSSRPVAKHVIDPVQVAGGSDAVLGLQQFFPASQV
jgi:hypothetical protein